MTHDPMCPRAYSARYPTRKGCGLCDIITAAHERGYKEAEKFYTNDCFLCGYAGEWSTSMCWQCELEQ